MSILQVFLLISLLFLNIDAATSSIEIFPSIASLEKHSLSDVVAYAMSAIRELNHQNIEYNLATEKPPCRRLPLDTFSTAIVSNLIGLMNGFFLDTDAIYPIFIYQQKNPTTAIGIQIFNKHDPFTEDALEFLEEYLHQTIHRDICKKWIIKKCERGYIQLIANFSTGLHAEIVFVLTKLLLRIFRLTIQYDQSSHTGRSISLVLSHEEALKFEAIFNTGLIMREISKQKILALVPHDTDDVAIIGLL